MRGWPCTSFNSSPDLSKFCSSVTYLITDNRSIDLGALSSNVADNEGNQ